MAIFIVGRETMLLVSGAACLIGIFCQLEFEMQRYFEREYNHMDVCVCKR